VPLRRLPAHGRTRERRRRPGPALLRRPGAHELALSDANLAPGRLQPDRFPFPLQRAGARALAAPSACAAR
jgi:hypothetical protein